MSQYEPVFKTKNFPEINRNITRAEFKKVFDYLLELGLENGYVQELKSHAVFLPDFTKENPFS
jgi:putative pyruvate formate lyase activating enzyme